MRRLWQTALELGVDVTVHSTDSFHVAESDEDRALWQPLPYRKWPTVGPKALGYATGMFEGISDGLRNGESVINQHGLWLHYGRVARIVGESLRVPVIIHTHGMLEPLAFEKSRWKKRIVARLWENENLSKAACVRVTGQNEFSSVRDFGVKNPIAFIPNGIDVEDFGKLPPPSSAVEQLPILKDRRVLLFVGRLNPIKGLPMLLKVWDNLGSLRRDWVLALAGPDHKGHARELEQMVAELGLNQSVKFLGPLFGERKLAAYALADILILPSLTENFGVAVAEALAASLPVITTTGTPWRGLPENDCGWWIERDERSIETALREAMSLTKAELSEMGARGRDWMARDFSWQRIAAQMKEVCEWTLGGGPTPGCVTLN